MKNILLVVHDDVGQDARIQAALDAARAVGGYLTCLDVAVVPDVVGDGYGSEAILMADERLRESDNRIKLEQRLSHEAVPWDWFDVSGQIAECVKVASALCDLIVVNRRLDSFPIPDMRAIAGELLIGTGKPILAVPETPLGVTFQGHAMIAWDGSKEAASALRLAVPLLASAAQVTLVEIADGTVQRRAEEATTYLARHGIFATVRPHHPQVPGTVGDIMAMIANLAPHYVVMGAYGHSRIREAILGGVTRHLLTHSPVPLLLAH